MSYLKTGATKNTEFADDISLFVKRTKNQIFRPMSMLKQLVQHGGKIHGRRTSSLN